MIGELKEKYTLPFSSIADQLGLSYTTLMRWKRRFAKGRPAVERPGPKKVRPLDLGRLEQEIGNLKHGKKRSQGVSRLYGAFNHAISRRDLARMVSVVPNETNRQKTAGMCHITWLKPNLAWAMDDCQKTGVCEGDKLHLHNLSDLCSRYRFHPLTSAYLPCGEEVAGHLEHQISRFGAPLFCKRDNGGNLNHFAVNDVLEDAYVIPINSPPYKAPYNGAIEHTQGEFKDYIRRWGWKANTIDELSLLAETAAHDLNHQTRRCLNGRTACSVYFGKAQIRYNKRRRKSIYNWIRDLAAEISMQAGKTNITATAWRVAAKQWLVKNGLIQIRMAGNVLPNFS